jgi:hypothetical protein
MISRVSKALATIGVLVFLFLPATQRSLPKTVWVVLFIATLTYGISLFLSVGMPPHRRWAIAYLAFVSLTYLLAGAWGFLRNGDLIEAAMWDSLISPYPLITFIDQLIHHFPHTMSRAPYETLPLSQHRLFSIAVIVVSAVATGAAFAMTKEKKAAYMVWLVLLGASIVAVLGYIIVGFVSWGMKETITPLCWEASYLIAYVVARSGTDLRSPTRTVRQP